MNKLDKKIQDLFCEVAYLKNWNDLDTFDNFVAIRNLIDRKIYTRSLAIWLLKKAKEGK
jgi:hypothetical protein